MPMSFAQDAAFRAHAPWWSGNPAARLVIRGGAPLVGKYAISGAKNAALPLMISALFSPHLVTLHNIPANLDVAVLSNLLARIGVKLAWFSGKSGLSLTLCADRIDPAQVDYALVGSMRASVLLLGALLARCGEASMPKPGGDEIGLRAIDFHLSGLRAMGATIDLSGGIIHAAATGGLRGADIRLPFPSVGATQNILLAAVLARGTTVIRNAAQEPENIDLARCLIMMGAEIHGVGSNVLTIAGDKRLGGAVHTVMPDRIELGTVACAAAMTDGEIVLQNVGADLFGTNFLGADFLGAAGPLLARAGVALAESAGGLVARRAKNGLMGIDILTTPYPGFATDLQAPAMALLSIAKGASTITETVFEHRFRHIGELRKMGANITVHGQTALVRGIDRLTGARVTATDVRAAAALVLAGLNAKGETILDGLNHLDRGYDRMAEKFVLCGADITRPNEAE